MEEQNNTGANSLETTVVITQILGRVLADGATVRGIPKRNSTRWVFDIEQRGAGSVELNLLEFTSKRELRPDVLSFGFVPTSPTACVAHIWGVEHNGRLTLHASAGEHTLSFRVSIDVLHSATR